MAESVTAKSGSGYEATARSFERFCEVFDMPVAFGYEQISSWMLHYTRQGFTSRSLPGHLSAFRWWADLNELAFPELDSKEWRRLKRAMRALRLRDPSNKAPCTPLTSDWVMAMLRADGFHSLDDMRRAVVDPARLADFLFWMRLLLSHAAMTRLCEVEEGLFISDVERCVSAKGDFYTLRIGYLEDGGIPLFARNRKLKFRLHRFAVLPVLDDTICAASMLDLYFLHVRPEALNSGSRLTLLVSATRYTLAPPLTGKAFLARMRTLAKAAGMDTAMVKKLEYRSLRAGGCTSYFAAGYPARWVADQGGWLSAAMEDYRRPSPQLRAEIFEQQRRFFER